MGKNPKPVYQGNKFNQNDNFPKHKIVKNVTNLLKLWPSKGEGHNKRQMHLGGTRCSPTQGKSSTKARNKIKCNTNTKV